MKKLLSLILTSTILFSSAHVHADNGPLKILMFAAIIFVAKSWYDNQNSQEKLNTNQLINNQTTKTSQEI